MKRDTMRVQKLTVMVSLFGRLHMARRRNERAWAMQCAMAGAPISPRNWAD